MKKALIALGLIALAGLSGCAVVPADPYYEPAPYYGVRPYPYYGPRTTVIVPGPILVPRHRHHHGHHRWHR